MTNRALKSILYVEDDGDIRTVAEIALVAVGGFELVICSSGKEALEKALSLTPDLLLLDVMMPEMDGPTTLEALRKVPNTANTPVIFMTAKVQASEVAYYKSLGALGVVAKPFDPMELAHQVRKLWDEQHG